jgi:hypothetical protein
LHDPPVNPCASILASPSGVIVILTILSLITF